MGKIRLGILLNEVAGDEDMCVSACQELNEQVEWDLIQFTDANWLSQCKNKNFNGFIAIPGAYTTSFKNLYDERLYILNKTLGLPVFPSLNEVLIFENKKMLTYWMEAKNIPHPKTWIFYHKKEALNFITTASFPIVAKTSIGAAGSGIIFLKNKKDAEHYILESFSGSGITRKTGPHLWKKGFLKRAAKKLVNPKEIKLKLFKYKIIKSDVQKSFVLFQEFINHDFEWRCVRIGDSFFAHKKLKLHNKTSGSLLKGYEKPPESLLNFVKKITDENNFLSQAVDIFEVGEDVYLVNEMQCIFGQSDPYQMLIDGVPGRYVCTNSKWIFEAGDFARNECFSLRLEVFVDILKKQLNL